MAPTPCLHCTKTSNTTLNLNSHVLFMHTPNRPRHICPACGRSFSNKLYANKEHKKYCKGAPGAAPAAGALAPAAQANIGIVGGGVNAGGGFAVAGSATHAAPALPTGGAHGGPRYYPFVYGGFGLDPFVNVRPGAYGTGFGFGNGVGAAGGPPTGGPASFPASAAHAAIDDDEDTDRFLANFQAQLAQVDALAVRHGIPLPTEASASVHASSSAPADTNAVMEEEEEADDVVEEETQWLEDQLRAELEAQDYDVAASAQAEAMAKSDVDSDGDSEMSS